VERAVRINKLALILLSGLLITALLSPARAGLLYLQNDNGEIGKGSKAGRTPGDIDGAVFFPPAEFFPMTLQSVEFVLHKPRTASNLQDSACVRVHAYRVENGVPIEPPLASSERRIVNELDQWISIPFTEPVAVEEPTALMAAVEWCSGTYEAGAPSTATDTNWEAPQEDKDAKNLYHDASIPPIVGCDEGFCNHSQFWGSQSNQVGYNMIRLVVDAAVEPTPTPTPTGTPDATHTPSPAPSPTPTEPGVPPQPTETPRIPPPQFPQFVYLPAIARNAMPMASRLIIGSEMGAIVGYPLTSGMPDQCWDISQDPTVNLWVGNDPDSGRGIMRSVLQIDLSWIPPDATILDAQLELFLFEVSGNPVPVQVTVHNVTRPWPSCPTWNTLADATGSEYASASIGSEIQFYRIDITPLLLAWIDAQIPNHGLLLRLADEEPTVVRGFIGPNSFQEDLWPRVVVRYLQP